MLLNILRGFTPQAALDAPRFCISAGMTDNEKDSASSAEEVNSEVYFEDGFSKETVAKLRGGHDVKVSCVILINACRYGT